MNTQTNPGIVVSFKAFSKWSGAAVSAVGLMVLIGWIFDIPALKNIHPSLVSMKANTAIAFLLAGISLWLQQSEQPKERELQIIRVCTGGVVLLGLLTLCEYLFGSDLGIDQLFFREPPGAVGTSAPGRMAPNTALSFLLLGLSLHYLDTETPDGKRPAQYLAIAALLISLLAFYGYFFGVTTLYGLASYTQMALHTMVAFNLLSLGILCARPERGVVEVVTSRDAGGVMARRLLTAVLVIPTLLGWLLVAGGRARQFETELGLSIFVVLIVFVFAALIWRNCVVLDRADKESKVYQSEKQASQYARSLIEASLDPLVTISLEGKITDVNEAAVKVTGVLREGLIGTDFSNYFTEPEKAREGYRQVFEKGFVTDYPLTIRHAEGQLTHVLYNASVYKDVEGKVLGVFAAARDITERKRAEENLKRVMVEIQESVSILAPAATKILSTTIQVASGAAETATAVSETTSTVEEVKQTAQVASAKARSVSDFAQKTVQTAQNGKKAVEESLAGMGRIQEQVEAIAESIVKLSEQSQTIGEIITTVNDLAEQSNLLAVNAAIEAAKAGEQGKGFAVVAQEVKSLADQSKEATAQVRTILNDIQKATNAAVLATEQGSKAVEAGMKQSREAGEAIRQMGESIEESAQAAHQIAASSQQQLTGMDQVALAMENIKQASEQNVAGMKQVETTVQNLHELGQKLKGLVEQDKV